MLYCDDCRKHRALPETTTKEMGECFFCGQQGTCWEDGCRAPPARGDT